MDPKNVKEEVKETVKDDSVETPPTKTSEVVPSPEVKVETPETPIKEVKEEVKVENKSQEQIDNLNIALREERKTNKENNEKYQKSLDENSEVIDSLRNVFVPKSEIEEDTEKGYLTEESLISILSNRDAEAKKKSQEDSRAKQNLEEIKELEITYDGTDGKLKYDDNEVLKWQETNQRLYLSPKEAFTAMKQADIIDYEVKQRLAGKKPAVEIDKPSAGGEVHIPTEEVLQTDSDVTNAVREAMEAVEAEI